MDDMVDCCSCSSCLWLPAVWRNAPSRVAVTFGGDAAQWAGETT